MACFAMSGEKEWERIFPCNFVLESSQTFTALKFDVQTQLHR